VPGVVLDTGPTNTNQTNHIVFSMGRNQGRQEPQERVSSAQRAMALDQQIGTPGLG
jgi:hypothetical protein